MVGVVLFFVLGIFGLMVIFYVDVILVIFVGVLMIVISIGIIVSVFGELGYLCI